MAIRKPIIKWHDKQYAVALKAQMNQRLSLVGEFTRGKVVKNISVSTRSHGPSRPGEYPHADTGRLRGSIYYLVDKLKQLVSIGTNVLYARKLELGSARMAPRPFLTRTVNENIAAIKRILLMPFKF